MPKSWRAKKSVDRRRRASCSIARSTAIPRISGASRIAPDEELIRSIYGLGYKLDLPEGRV